MYAPSYPPKGLQFEARLGFKICSGDMHHLWQYIGVVCALLAVCKASRKRVALGFCILKSVNHSVDNHLGLQGER